MSRRIPTSSAPEASTRHVEPRILRGRALGGELRGDGDVGRHEPDAQLPRLPVEVVRVARAQREEQELASVEPEPHPARRIGTVDGDGARAGPPYGGRTGA